MTAIRLLCLSCASHLQAPQPELRALTQTFGDRGVSISNGLILQGKRFEVSAGRAAHAGGVHARQGSRKMR